MLEQEILNELKEIKELLKQLLAQRFPPPIMPPPYTPQPTYPQRIVY